MEQKQKIKVYRTKEGTIFEIVFAVLLIVVWALIITFVNRAPDIIPTHFGLDGQPNGWGSKYGILVVCAIMSVVGIGLMVLAYYPHKVNMPAKASTPSQFAMVVRFTRVMALMMVALTFVIGWTSLVAYQNDGGPSALPILSVLGVLLLVIIVFSILTYFKK